MASTNLAAVYFKVILVQKNMWLKYKSNGNKIYSHLTLTGTLNLWSLKTSFYSTTVYLKTHIRK